MRLHPSLRTDNRGPPMNYIAIRPDNSRTSMSSSGAGANDRRRATVKRCPASMYGRATVDDGRCTLSRRSRQHEQGTHRDTCDRNGIGSSCESHLTLHVEFLLLSLKDPLHHGTE